MKTLNDYIIESYNYYDRNDEDEYENAYHDYEERCESSRTTLYFENQSALMLYLCEFKAQLSDGMYENIEPEYHWLWVPQANKFKFDSKPGFRGIEHLVKYDFTDLNMYNDADIESRLLNYGRFGTVLGDSKIYTEAEYECLGNCINQLPMEKTMEYDEYVNTLNKSDYNKCKNIFTEENYNKFYTTKYDIKNVIKDIKSCNNTVNTKLG